MNISPLPCIETVQLGLRLHQKTFAIREIQSFHNLLTESHRTDRKAHVSDSQLPPMARTASPMMVL